MSETTPRLQLRDSTELRCPYCHDGGFSKVPSLRCERCHAWQHAACSQEAGKCGACSNPVTAEPVQQQQPGSDWQAEWQAFARAEAERPGSVSGAAMRQRGIGNVQAIGDGNTINYDAPTPREPGPIARPPWTEIDRDQVLPGWKLVDGNSPRVISTVAVEHLLDPETMKPLPGEEVWLDPNTQQLYRAVTKKKLPPKTEEPEKKSYIMLTARGYEIAESLRRQEQLERLYLRLKRALEALVMGALVVLLTFLFRSCRS